MREREIDSDDLLDEYGLAGEAPTPASVPSSSPAATPPPAATSAPGAQGIADPAAGGPVVGHDGSFEGLGDLLQKSPAFAQAVAARMARSAPILRKQPLQKTRDLQLAFGPIKGKKGTTETLVVTPQCYFRGEKLMATDDAPQAGTGTRIKNIFVGQRAQMPAVNTGGVLSAFMNPGALGSGIRLDTCQPGITISLVVEFIQDCTFDAVLFGEAIG